MTKEELCIHACRYAIRELTRKGSTGFITSSHEGGQQITWVEVMDWLNREQQPYYNPDEWCHDCKEYDNNRHCCPRLNRVIRNAVEEVKKPKTGHWIKDIHNKILCSNCGKLHDVFDTDRWFEEHKYCYSCGARMIEPQTESEG